MSDDDGGCFGMILGWLIVIGLVILVIVYVVIPFLITVAGIGGIYGGGVAIGNYGKSFRKNIFK